MKLFLIFLPLYLGCIQFIDSKLCRMQPDDELYQYTIDKRVPHVTEYFNISQFELELIDDDIVHTGGYPECIKSMDSTLPLSMAIRSEFFENAKWNEGPVRLIVPDICAEFLNPSRFWYNITKLWTTCPPKVGDKWFIESQTVDMQTNLPPSIQMVPWKAYLLFFQGLVGPIKQFGLMLRIEIIEVV